MQTKKVSFNPTVNEELSSGRESTGAGDGGEGSTAAGDDEEGSSSPFPCNSLC